MSASATDRPAPLRAILAVTFLGSVAGGVFWAAIFFVTAAHYGFSPSRNLVLAAAMGTLYALTAATTGHLMRTLLARWSPRAVLQAALAAWTAAGLLPLFAAGEPAMWAAGLLGAVASALTWPVVESYLGAGRHGADMRAAIGWFNVTWTPAVAAGLLLLPLVSRASALGPLALSAAGSAAALLSTWMLPRQPGAHEAAAAAGAVGVEYPRLRQAAQWLLPFSYVLCSAMSPVLPHRLAELGALGMAGVIAALWMVARFVTLLAMWQSGFWHGRWGTLAIAAVALAVGLAGILLAPTLALLAAGLVVFGTGMGLTYYASLYYALAVGRAEVDAGGNFEALIGLGYLGGPLLGVAARAALPGASAAATVGLSWLVMAAGAVGALRAYLAARRARARS